MGKILQVNFFDFLIAFVIIFLCFIISYRKKKTIKVINTHLMSKRILEYRPEQLINDAETSLVAKTTIEIPMPKDTSNCLNLAKVNYMNLLNDDTLKKEAEKCIRTYGVGSCGPRGFYGTIDVHLDLENRIAEFLELEETVLYSYGFSTISSAIGAYCKKNDVILCDEEISFAAIQGLLAARCNIVYFKHNDPNDLEKKLQEINVKEKDKKRKSRKFLIIEGIYSKTGQICPLPKLVEISKKHKMRIFLNESHSFGILGKTGRGVTEHFNVNRADIDMIMGSLETSLGSVGGFCVGASVVIEHQRLSGLGYCFSASLPPFLSYVPLCAINMFEENPVMFEKLRDVSIRMHKELEALNDHYTNISDPISPLKVLSVKDENNVGKAEKIFNFCTNSGLCIVKIDERLQMNVNVDMKDEEMKRAVTTLSKAFNVT